MPALQNPQMSTMMVSEENIICLCITAAFLLAAAVSVHTRMQMHLVLDHAWLDLGLSPGSALSSPWSLLMPHEHLTSFSWLGIKGDSVLASPCVDTVASNIGCLFIDPKPSSEIALARPMSSQPGGEKYLSVEMQLSRLPGCLRDVGELMQVVRSFCWQSLVGNCVPGGGPRLTPAVEISRCQEISSVQGPDLVAPVEPWTQQLIS